MPSPVLGVHKPSTGSVLIQPQRDCPHFTDEGIDAGKAVSWNLSPFLCDSKNLCPASAWLLKGLDLGPPLTGCNLGQILFSLVSSPSSQGRWTQGSLRALPAGPFQNGADILGIINKHASHSSTPPHGWVRREACQKACSLSSFAPGAQDSPAQGEPGPASSPPSHPQGAWAGPQPLPLSRANLNSTVWVNEGKQ